MTKQFFPFCHASQKLRFSGHFLSSDLTSKSTRFLLWLPRNYLTDPWKVIYSLESIVFNILYEWWNNNSFKNVKIHGNFLVSIFFVDDEDVDEQISGIQTRYRCKRCEGKFGTWISSACGHLMCEKCIRHPKCVCDEDIKDRFPVKYADES